jgi:hypothetical protein
MHFVGFVKELDMALLTVFEIRLSNLLARKFQNYNIYIDSIEKIWQKSLVRINFHWPYKMHFYVCVIFKSVYN